MKNFSKYFVVISLIAMLSACSSGRRDAAFSLDGVSAPVRACLVDPQSFGQAEPVADFQNGNGCGISNGYRVFSVANINFSEPATVTCGVADTLNTWIGQSVQPTAQQIYGSQVVSFKVAASYACRPRNNVRGAKLSEHGFGNAIDLAGFTLANGREIIVVRDYYGNSQDQQFLRTIRAKACGPFHTVLGPGSDYNHRDHIHLDLQKERSGGPYCH
jgi:hypothetical protein